MNGAARVATGAVGGAVSGVAVAPGVAHVLAVRAAARGQRGLRRRGLRADARVDVDARGAHLPAGMGPGEPGGVSADADAAAGRDAAGAVADVRDADQGVHVFNPLLDRPDEFKCTVETRKTSAQHAVQLYVVIWIQCWLSKYLLCRQERARGRGQ